MNIAVIIPIYKEFLSISDKTSLKRCFEVLGDYSIIFVTHKKLNQQEYINLIRKDYSNSEIKFVYFNSKYFRSIEGYNELMLSRGFYKTFLKFSFVLIYQLDAFVFQDGLEEWCKKDFDYVGAPWFQQFGTSDSLEFFGVGNGGFSLRKPKIMLNIINNWRSLYPLRQFCSTLIDTRSNKIKLFFRFICEVCLIKQNSFSLFPYYGFNEDYVWGHIFGEKMNVLTTPTPEEALRFAFEDKPEFLYKINKNNLPFGCHAWEKYNVEFWEQFIKKESAE